MASVTSVGIERHDIALLEGDIARLPRVGRGGLSVVEHDDVRAVAGVYGRVSRTTSTQRTLSRLRYGYRFFELVDRGVTAGYGWFAAGKVRYLDELAIELALPDDALWVRDVFIPPSRRGQGLFGSLLSLVASQSPERRRFFSDVSWTNVASLRAHANVGFALRGRVRGWNLGRLIVRTKLAQEVCPGAGIADERRVLYLGASESSLHRERIA